MDLKKEINLQLLKLRENSKNSAVLVEGKKDKNALEKFKVTNVITLTKPLFQVVESISNNFSRCILLLDLDRAGNGLYSKLKDDLQRNGVKVDTRFRSFLSKYTGLKEIEGIATFVKHFNNKNNYKTKE